MTATPKNPDINAEIRKHWEKVCEEFPNATTPQVAKKVAEDFGVSVSRIFEAFGKEGE